ncbi:MAG: 4-hydroxy-tetrahydrodipicolinate reductase [Dokdonella sp.]
MSALTRIALNGASGRMGQALLRLLGEQGGLQLVAGVVRAGSAAESTACNPAGLVFTSSVPADVEIDVLIDFAGAQAFDAALQLACQRGAAFVSGSTGLSAAQHAALQVAAETIPVLWSPNFSLGVVVLAELLEQAARLLPEWDCEILESHHRHKLDAPSGTALMLGARAAQGRGQDPRVSSLLDPDRSGARVTGSIGYAVTRGGDVVGEHHAILFGDGERVELIHRASNRDIFARGALTAASWIAGRAPRVYQLRDVLQAP